MKRKTDSLDSNRPSKRVKLNGNEIGSFLDSDESDPESADSSTSSPQQPEPQSTFYDEPNDLDHDDELVEQDEFDLDDFDDGSDSKKHQQSSDTDPEPNPDANDDDDFLGLGSDDSEEEGDGFGKLETMAALQDARKEQIRMDVEAEQREQMQMDDEERAKDLDWEFPSPKTLKEEKEKPPQLELLKHRIESILEILSSFKALSDGKHMRREYISVLSHAMARYYGYDQELVRMFLSMFNPNECLAFLEANEQSRPLTIRTNTLKCRRRDLAKMLIDRGVNIDPLADWTKEGLKIAKTGATVPIGATPEYLAGYYMIQSAASLLPVMALGVKGGMKVLDMCAAPGGKTTHIAALMKGEGQVLANDVNHERLKAVYGNVHRMGFKNVVIHNTDGTKMADRFHPIFDRVLLDAPCSCLGVISRDPSIKYNKKLHDCLSMSMLQKKLLLAAIDVCKVGGFVVYSTCSISHYENEGVVDYALNHRFVKVVDTKLPFGEEGFTKMRQFRFHSSIKSTRRYYPHVHNLDGFYVAKLVKNAVGKRGDQKKYVDLEEQGLKEHICRYCGTEGDHFSWHCDDAKKERGEKRRRAKEKLLRKQARKLAREEEMSNR